ncbi:uncharacterized protein LOC126827797 isoform X2 [Patella vulgata]|uniref:uncharacterized protein LOC126827797 isoform X2 n=1 Tax=Patella vulgata TaxID=6465 RepID=UPI0024A7E547|nr:uncharacterized protein LOC126827797 isoform X2 [Patella vulgata]
MNKMADNELDWDHAADFGERDPLLERNKAGRDMSYRSGGVNLSYEEAVELLTVLDTSRFKLQQYISNADETSVVETVVIPVPGRWLRIRKNVLPRIARNIVFITIILQAVNLLILSLIDIWPRKDSEDVIVTSAVTMIVVQLLNLIALVYTSVELAGQLFKRTVSNILLAQCYLATILLFTGIYILTYRLKPVSWKFIQQDLNSSPDLVIVLYIKLFFFSVSTATLSGTANVLPAEWYNYIFTSFQMLLSFVYFTSILGQSISRSSTPTRTPPQKDKKPLNYGSTTTNHVYNNHHETSIADSSIENSVNIIDDDITQNHSTTRVTLN